MNETWPDKIDSLRILYNVHPYMRNDKTHFSDIQISRFCVCAYYYFQFNDSTIQTRIINSVFPAPAHKQHPRGTFISAPKLQYSTINRKARARHHASDNRGYGALLYIYIHPRRDNPTVSSRIARPAILGSAARAYI